MKFQRLLLDESLFDDTISQADSSSIDAFCGYDDEFVGTDLPVETLEGPKSGTDVCVTDNILSLITDELNTIRAYNSIIESLKLECATNPEYQSFIDIINDINSEENKHVGQLQEILKRLSPNAKLIDAGRIEGKQQFSFRNGLLQVQSWETKNSDSSPTTDECTLTNIDDDM